MKIKLAIAICAGLLLTAYLGGPEQFGQKISAKGAKAPEAILTEMKAAKRDSVWIKVSGPVREVCQMKGCWMTIDVAGQAMRIKFKDYAFFVPKNSVGRTMVIEGWATQKVTPEEERKHYAEDAGKSAEEIAKINGEERSLSFEAVGVLMMPAK